MRTWQWDDQTVPDAAVVYRRIAASPSYRVPDPINNVCHPHISALSIDRRKEPTGLSGHLKELLPAHRQPPALYKPVPTGGVIEYEVGVARIGSRSKVGVVIIPHCLEREVALRDAHVECRTETPKGKHGKNEWVLARGAILDNYRWAQLPISPCENCAALDSECAFLSASH